MFKDYEDFIFWNSLHIMKQAIHEIKIGKLPALRDDGFGKD